MSLQALPVRANSTASTACCWGEGARLVHAVPKCCAHPWGTPHAAEQHWELWLPSLGPVHLSCPTQTKGRAVLTQMTRFGEPMLEPGGEMEVSDVLLCCGGRKAEDR